jgi:hypothetical protein
MRTPHGRPRVARHTLPLADSAVAERPLAAQHHDTALHPVALHRCRALWAERAAMAFHGRSVVGRLVVALLIATGFGGMVSHLAASSTAARGSIPTLDHIFVIVMENKSANQIIGNESEAPYLNQLASRYGLAANYRAVTHPSFPNYLALTGGDTFGITQNCNDCFVDAPNLVVDRVVPSGRTWKAYMEAMPSPCFLGDAYPYAQKHNPFIYYNNIRLTEQCSRVVPFSHLAADLASASTTPNFVFLTPDLCNDMHDCPIASGDAWLSRTVPAILSSPAYAVGNSLVVITWDEDDFTAANQVATLLISPVIAPGVRSEVAYTHYSLLRTIEQAWDLAPLTANDAAASPMSDFFTAPAGADVLGTS